MRSVMMMLAAAVLTGPVRAAGPDVSHMKLIFDDEFDGKTLDLSKWQIGAQPNGSQWGSDAYFVTSKIGDEALVPKVYRQADGILTIRANYDAAFKDPVPWEQKWYSGMITTAFADGRSPSATFRRGCVMLSAKMPSGLGVWPGFWALNLAAMQGGGDPMGPVELDGLEAYGGQMKTLYSTTHWWTQPAQHSGGGAKVSDMSTGFHTYHFCIGSDTMTVYFDGQQVNERPLYRSAGVDKFFWMINLAMGGGWPITVPPDNAYDLQLDYVRIWSADDDAVAAGQRR